MSLLWSELRLHRASLAIWVLAIALLMAMMAAVYPSIRGNPELDSIYGSLSPSAQQLLGGSDLTSPAGYLSTQVFAFFLPAVIFVYALGRAAATLAGEEEDRTLDLLLAQPLARWMAYAQKAAAVVIGIAVLCLATFVPLLALNRAVHFDLPLANLAGIVTQLFLFCVALAMCTMALSAAAGRRAIGVAVVIGYIVVSYLVYGLSSTIAWMGHLRPLALWRWYAGNDPLRSGFGGVEVAVLLCTTVIAVLIGMWAFQRRDLHA
jgi:ABC-2 type transport system permease protein